MRLEQFIEEGIPIKFVKRETLREGLTGHVCITKQKRGKKVMDMSIVVKSNTVKCVLNKKVSDLTLVKFSFLVPKRLYSSHNRQTKDSLFTHIYFWNTTF